MPLVKRAVEPAALCRQSLPKNVKSELECVTNNTLSGVILQLSSLSVQAEDVFGELFTEASAFYLRANKLQDRIDKLNDKVQSLDSNVEEVALHDINMRKAFRSSGITDQQVVSRESLSRTLQDTYNRAHKPPPLQDLNPYRDDGRDALKIYTDPDYFFNLWRDAMQKEMRNAKEKRREQRKRERKANPTYRQERKVRAAVPKQRMKAKQMEKGVEFADAPSAKVEQNHVNANSKAHPPESMPNQTNNIPSPPSPEYISQKANDHYTPTIRPPSPPPAYVGHPPPPSDLPEPPLPPPLNGPGMPDYPTSIPPPPPSMGNNIPPPPPPVSNSVPGAPAPPPPPPPPADAPLPPPANQGGMAAQLANVKLKEAPQEEETGTEGRSDLLQAIRHGFNLKKVEQREKTASTGTGGNDVASILARRIAVEFSDSESDSYSDEDDDDWN